MPPAPSEELEQAVKEERLKAEQKEKDKCTPSRAWEMLGYVGAVTAGVCQPLIMQQSIQNTLDPAHRAAVLAAHAFLIPLEEVFCFLEDTMTVRINFAMGAGDLQLVRSLFKAGIYFGLGMGAVAAFIATTLTFSTTTFRALVYPEGGIVTSLSQSCSLLLSADDVRRRHALSSFSPRGSGPSYSSTRLWRVWRSAAGCFGSTAGL